MFINNNNNIMLKLEKCEGILNFKHEYAAVFSDKQCLIWKYQKESKKVYMLFVVTQKKIQTKIKVKKKKKKNLYSLYIYIYIYPI